MTMRWIAWRTLLGLAGACLPAVAFAQGFFLPATDSRLRDDIALLVDEGVINLPVNAWPLPARDVADAVERVDVGSILEPGLQAALLHVQRRTRPADNAGEWQLREVSVTAGEEGLLRDNATLGRDYLEVSSRGGATTDRWGLALQVTGVASPQDRKDWRLDGTELTVRWGNWLFSANALSRWWGPGRDGSLILSTNARPMPGLSLDRMASEPFRFPVLRWLGPWRFSGFVSAMESHRPDVDDALFMGMRLSFKPVPIMEIGLSRTAQFCGQNEAGTRPSCNLSQFRRVLLGSDNTGIRVDPELEPGNQMAGVDVRLVSPIKAVPVAVYAQLIGEDNSSTGIPERYLGLFGAEGWWLRDNGSVLRARVEYADTSCKYYSPNENPDCAYRHHIFQAGYRYRGRNIGHTTDSDSESTGASLSLRQANGQEWGVHLRRVSLDRYGGVDGYNPLTRGAGRYHAAQLSWSGAVFGQDIALQAGVERREPGGGPRETRPFGFLQWRKSL